MTQHLNRALANFVSQHPSGSWSTASRVPVEQVGVATAEELRAAGFVSIDEDDCVSLTAWGRRRARQAWLALERKP